MIRIACCQYQIETLPDWNSYNAKIQKLVFDAKNECVNVLLMPEYAGIEIVCKKYDTDEELFTELEPLIAKYLDYYINLAVKNHIYIQPGTIIEKMPSGRFVNRAYFFSPGGSVEYQDKLQLTAYEKSSNRLQQGNQQKIFETPFGKIGIAICYDSEFPEIIRCLVKRGASIILVPSYTTTLAGYYRVMLSCRARAIENQCYVATSFAINKNDLSGTTDETYGQAAIFSPADTGFPDDGILAQGIMNLPMLVTSSLTCEALDMVRMNGQVHNFEDGMHYIAIKENDVKSIQFL